MFIKLKDKELEEKQWQMWLMKYINMDKKTFKPFEYQSKIENTKVSKKSKEEILDEVAKIRKSLEKR